jgi:competence ComEA-like helix-hairpin-helix protein
MNRENPLQNDQQSGVDFRPQVLVALALLLTVWHLAGQRLSGWFSDRGEKKDPSGQYVWISRADGKSGLYRTDEAFVEGESGPAAIHINENGRAVQMDLPAHLAPFFYLPVSLNRADSELLMTLPGIGPRLAERIIALREKKGRFESIEELLQIPGISSRKLSFLAPLVHCD